MGKKRKTKQEIVETTKEVEVDIEEVQEQQEIVLVCDLCGNEETPRSPEFHELAHNPKFVLKEPQSTGSKRVALGGLGKSLPLTGEVADSAIKTRYNRVTLSADDALILCDYCYQNLFE